MRTRLSRYWFIGLTAICAVQALGVPAGKPIMAVGEPILRDISYTPDGRYLATATDAYIDLLDSTTDEPVSRMEPGGRSLHFSADGSRLGVYSADSMYHVWNMDTKTIIGAVPDGDGDTVDVLRVNDGELVAQVEVDPEPDI